MDKENRDKLNDLKSKLSEITKVKLTKRINKEKVAELKQEIIQICLKYVKK